MSSPEPDASPSNWEDQFNLPHITPLAVGHPARRVFLRAVADNDLIVRLIRMFGLPDLEAGPHGRAAQLALWFFGKRAEDYINEFANTKRLMNTLWLDEMKTETGYPDPQESDELVVTQWYLERAFPEDASDGPAARPASLAILTPPPSHSARRSFATVHGLSPIPLKLSRQPDEIASGVSRGGLRKREASPGENASDQRFGAKRRRKSSGGSISPEPGVIETEITQRQPDPDMDLIRQLELSSDDQGFDDSDDSDGNGSNGKVGDDSKADDDGEVDDNGLVVDNDHVVGADENNIETDDDDKPAGQGEGASTPAGRGRPPEEV